jgi:hypothetical protein
LIKAKPREQFYTDGRRSKHARQMPAGGTLEGDQAWIVAQRRDGQDLAHVHAAPRASIRGSFQLNFIQSPSMLERSAVGSLYTCVGRRERPSPMQHRAEEYNKAAAACLELAPTATDAKIRAALLLMAQNWLRLVNRSDASDQFEALLQDFNDQQMTRH